MTRHKRRHFRLCVSSAVSSSAFFIFSLLLLTSNVLCKSQSDGTPPEGAASLAFVFDITGSMYDDLVQVIDGAAKILEKTLIRREKPLYNYVLVPFHDPEVGPVIVTTDPSEFQKQLQDVYVQGGGDCPEMSVNGVKKALEVSLPSSFIYVFTDARSKDYHLVDEVLTLIQVKQSQVVFVLTGDCGDDTHPGFKVYETIASTSSGQVFLLKKSQVNEVLNFVKVAVQSRRVNLLSVDRKGPAASVLKIPVDSKLQQFTVSVSGDRPRIVLKDPNGNTLTRRTGLKQLLKIKKVLIYNVRKPKRGIWRLKVSSTGPHTIRVTGLSTLGFVARFSKKPTDDIKTADFRPIKGIPTHLYVNTTSLKSPGAVTQLDLVDLEGKTLSEHNIVRDDKVPSLYNVSSFVPPNDFFYIKVTGVDDKGYVFQRTTPTAISAEIPISPEVYMPSVTKGFYGKTVVVKCSVFSLVPYKLQWFRDDQPITAKVSQADSNNFTYSVARATSAAEGTYSCNATNDAGSTSAQTYLDISEPPPTITNVRNISVIPGRTALLDCIAHSTVPINRTWYRPNHFLQMETNPRMTFYRNGSLQIRHVRNEDEGAYVCKVSNEGGHAEATMYIRVQVPPIARVYPQTQNFQQMGTINITCVGHGYPYPNIIFLRRGKYLLPSSRISVAGGVLVMTNMQQSDEGLYECIAKNSAGEDVASASVKYIEAPEITLYERKVFVATGNRARMFCRANGIPTPKVEWFKGETKLEDQSFAETTKNGELVIYGTQESDAGLYRCEVSNDAGSDYALIQLDVGSEPVMTQIPTNTGVDIEGNTTLPCSATGRPTPSIRWKYPDGSVVPRTGHIRQLPSNGLFIQGISLNDQGLYTCTATNQFGAKAASAFVTVTGIVRPLIAYSNPFVEAVESTSVRLRCVILLGNPRPQLKWVRNGEVITDSATMTVDSDGSLIMHDIVKDQEGVYTCMASNIGGNASYEVQLNVQVPPRLINTPENKRSSITTVEGTYVSLPCLVSGDPEPEISWTKDGQAISITDSHYYITEDGSLDIYSTESEDTGFYKCSAVNIAGSIEKDINLFVQVPPKLSGSPDETIEVIEHNSVLLPCQVSGKPEPDVYWRRNFSPFRPKSENYVFNEEGLIMEDTLITDKAIYECIAANVAGNVTKIITLIVQVPPVIRSTGKDSIIVLENEPIVLECETTGDPVPEVTWKKDGAVRVNVFDSDGAYALVGTGSLSIREVELGDTGIYTCVSHNAAGTATRDIRLTVHAPPSLPDIIPSKSEIIERNPVVLPCPVRGTPQPIVTWYKDNKPVELRSDGPQLLPDGSLELPKTLANDSGRYTCRAVNVAGNISHSIDLKIFVPPRLVGEPVGVPETSVVVIEKSVTLNCPVEGDPPPEITWLKNGSPLTNEEFGRRLILSDDRRRITVLQSAVGDTARYTCIAANVAGELKKQIDLDVHIPPTINNDTVTRKDNSVVITRSFTFFCPATGIPPPKITWFKNGKPLTPGTRSNFRIYASGRRLEVRAAQLSDTATYECVADNEAGSITKQFNLDVWVPPEIDEPEKVKKVEVVTNRSLTLVCPVSGIPKPQVTWYKNSKRVYNSQRVQLLDDNWTLKLSPAHPSDTAKYTCRAKNAAGEDEKVFDVNVWVPARINRTDVVTSPRVVINNTVSLHCPASGIPTPEIRWFKDGRRLDASKEKRIKILSGGRQLQISSSQLVDTAGYTCVATNIVTEDTLDYDLQVYVPSKIDNSTIDPLPKVVIDGRITIDCPATGVPPPRITWYKNGEEISVERYPNLRIKSNGRKLELTRAAVRDTALYTCKAENDAGTSKQNFELQVQVPPKIPARDVNLKPNVIVNTTKVLSCPAAGIPPPKIVWFRNNQAIDYRRNINIQVLERGRKLRISNIQVNDTAIYTCIATNQAGQAELEFNVNVWVAPKIDKTSENPRPRIIKGHSMVLSCPVSGVPFPEITWYKDNKRLVPSRRVRLLNGGVQLEIIKSHEDDTAKYTCRATNGAGSDELDIDLTILVPPSIDESNLVTHPRIIVNRTMVLECPVSGIPKPQVIWLRQDKPIQLNARMALSKENRVLTIVRAQDEDNGRYTCIAVNEAGELQRNFQLKVLVPPSFDMSKLRTELTVIENGSVSINCPVMGIPPPSVVWLRDREPIIESAHANLRIIDNDQRIEITNVQVSDTGKYTCVASNVAGEVDKLFNLNVHVPPSIEASSVTEDLTVIVGEPETLGCSATGIPTPSIQWLKAGEPVDVDGETIRLLSGGELLQFLHTSTDDTSKYTCRAENAAGVAEKYYRLTVIVPPSFNDSDALIKRSVILNKLVSLECVSSGIPKPLLTWIREGSPIPHYGNPSIRILQNGRILQIANAQLLDVGRYTCLASNLAGNASKDYDLTVLVPPSIKDAPTQVSATQYSRTLLMCEAIGLPEPTVTWLKDKQPFDTSTFSVNSRHRMHRSGTLEFSDVRLEDAGIYMCIAENKAGIVTREATLYVLVPPSIDKSGAKVFRVVIGNRITLPCNVSGTPKPRVLWQKGTAVIYNSQASRISPEDGSLSIYRAELRDSGVYICIAQNNAGTDIHQIRLLVQVPAKIRQNKRRFTVSQNGDIRLPCRASGTPRPYISWKKDRRNISPTDYRFRVLRSGWLLISVVRASDAGLYTCTATNNAGSATADVQLVVYVSPTIKEAPRFMTANVDERAEMPCEVSGIPRPSLTWKKNGRIVKQSDGRYSVAPSGALIVAAVKLSDTATYRCTASNVAGYDTQDITLRVQVPPVFIVKPRNTEVTIGERVEFMCVARGTPSPTIVWKKNNAAISTLPSVNGRGLLVIRSADKGSGGLYTCVAQNPAGTIETHASIIIKVPPRVLVPPGNKAVTVAERVILSCSVGGDPLPKIIWTKNGRPVTLSERIQQLSNGSLVIYHSTSSDAGEYKCVASNDAGTSEGVALLTIKKGPTFVIEPRDKTVQRGDSIVFNCVADGEPHPTIEWRRLNTPILSKDRVTVMPNNSLRIIASQLSDQAVYRCIAGNYLGRILVEVTLTVIVHGNWSAWSPWGVCSASCGEGTRKRLRNCTNPTPENGGRNCTGARTEYMSCGGSPCPVDGQWGNWLSWQPCSSSCGDGVRIRERLCDNPVPQNGGTQCVGKLTDSMTCHMKACPVDGGWGSWNEWQACSVSCGAGTRERQRRCDNPKPSSGGKQCEGQSIDEQPCHAAPCSVDGSWNAWSPWSSCSLSCGGGSMTRVRVCDAPPPSHGGNYCPGLANQTDYCHNQPCPVHGAWSSWSVWGICTASCNGGQRKRFRSCSNPAPSHGGQACVGRGEDVGVCNDHVCPVIGQWQAWNEWTACSKTCGTGTRRRSRVCTTAAFGGVKCVGDAVQLVHCQEKKCSGLPRRASANVIGNINDVEFGISKLDANIVDGSDYRTVNATLQSIPGPVGKFLRPLLSILTPIYWTTAHEVDGASNGFTLTKGKFRRDTQVEFATGEIVKMTHIARGVDSQGTLHLDIVVRGNTPNFANSPVNVFAQPYNEKYIQTALGSIYAFSSRTFRVNGMLQPYAWNHTIQYSVLDGKMPYLIQEVVTDNLAAEYFNTSQTLQFSLQASIHPGNPPNQCPPGFFLDPDGPFCYDDDECIRIDPCSHTCHNTPASFSCSCPQGFTLEADGRTCRDIDECLASPCAGHEQCINNQGSYTCSIACTAGYVASPDGLTCLDINECETDPCDHMCSNTPGSFTCTCRQGYMLHAQTKCTDVDECREGVSPCSHTCINTLGSFLCSCRPGYELTNGRHCSDIDECSTWQHGCYLNQVCVNTPGSHKCVCNRGFRKSHPRGPCLDINECRERRGVCQFQCRNTYGSFECICPPNYRRLPDKKSCAGLQFLEKDPWTDRCPGGVCALHRGTKKCPPGFVYRDADASCVDVDECQLKKCAHKCVNTPGSYRCICPPGYKLTRNKRKCRDIDECQRDNIDCGPDRMCFNHRGGYECLDIPCPPKYTRDPMTKYCMLECGLPGVPACPPGSRYADILQFRTLALPSGIPPERNLIRLTAFNQYNRYLPHTSFTMLENDPKIRFGLRVRRGRGVVFATEPLNDAQSYVIKVRASSFTRLGGRLEYRTTFLIHISVAAYAY